MDNVTTNRPYVDLAQALEPAALAAWLDYEYAQHVLNKNVLLARYEKFLTVTKDGINDDVMVGHASDFTKELKAEITSTDATRTKIKAPVLHAQRLIDGQAKKLTDELANAGQQVTWRITEYLREKEARERKAAEEEARQLALAADEAMRLADEANTPSADDAAVLALHEAQQAAAQAGASTLDLTRTRSQGGSLAALKDNWVYEIVDLSKVPTAYLTINDTIAKAAIKSGVREIPGLRIWNDAKAFVR